MSGLGGSEGGREMSHLRVDLRDKTCAGRADASRDDHQARKGASLRCTRATHGVLCATSNVAGNAGGGT